MKKYLFLAIAATVAASCAKTPAPAESYDPVAPEVGGGIVDIQFGSNVTAKVESKAAVATWGSQSLYIYGFPRTKNAESAVVPDYANPYINNVKASAPSDGTTGPINVYDASKAENTPYYYQGTTTYDFFGYYVQDAYANAGPDTDPAPTISAENDAYNLDIVIDGTQDVMIAKADVASAVANVDPSNLGDDWNDGYAFSAYAARRGVHPILKFEHLLTQLSFLVESGTDFTESDPNQLYVKDIAVKAVPNTAALCVAGAATGLTVNTEATEDLKVKKDDDTALEAVVVPTKGVEAVAVGQSIMLFPSESFVIDFTVARGSADSDVTETISKEISHTSITTDGQTKFAAGYSYKITFKVYGLEDIEINAELTDWVDGGAISIDTDEKPEI